MRSQEQEFKTILTESQSMAIQTAYPFAAPFTQTNRYFDTVAGQLAKADVGLRTRAFADHAEQTLKVPKGPHRQLTEITDVIPLAAVTTIQPGGDVCAWLNNFGLDAPLHLFAQATTTRRLCQLPAGLLTLDETRYTNGRSDHELELEYTDYATAKAFYSDILKRFALVTQRPTNKVVRARDNMPTSQAD